jgi:acetolactate synthase-1/2/3 large subunit
MRATTAARAAVEAIKSWGVTHVFGLPGTGNLDIYDAFYGDPDVQLVTARHEQGAAHMAEGYAKGSGKPGVCLVARAPGAANTLIATFGAYSESWPMIVLVGEPGTDILGNEAFEEADLVAMFRPVTKWAMRVPRAERLVEFMMKAYREALSGRPRPVMLAIPHDYQTREVTMDDTLRPPPIPSPPHPAKEGVERALQALAGARFPLILAGGGVVRARATDLLVEFAELLALPVVTTFVREDAFPNDHPLYLGNAGPSKVAATEKALDQADLVIALGCRFSELTTNRFTRPFTRLIHVDIDPHEIGRLYPAEIGLVSDLHAFLTEALELARQRDQARLAPSPERRARLQELREEYRSPATRPIKHSPVAIHPSEVAALLADIQQPDDVFVADSTTLGGWLSRHLCFTRPGSLVSTAGGCLGMGFPNALGFKLARPDTRVICLVGDGSFMMVPQELETAVRYKINLVTLVMNNSCYANVKIKQASHYQGRFIGVDFCNPDFALLAKAFGAHGERASRPEELMPALERCLAYPGPSLIDVILDPEDLGSPGTTFFLPGGAFDATRS